MGPFWHWPSHALAGAGRNGAGACVLGSGRGRGVGEATGRASGGVRQVRRRGGAERGIKLRQGGAGPRQRWRAAGAGAAVRACGRRGRGSGGMPQARARQCCRAAAAWSGGRRGAIGRQRREMGRGGARKTRSHAAALTASCRVDRGRVDRPCAQWPAGSVGLLNIYAWAGGLTRRKN